MNSNDFYKLKYLKYKNKYVNYKKNILEQKGGTVIKWMFSISIPNVYRHTSNK